MRLLDQWIVDHNLDVKWIEGDEVFKLGTKDFQYIDHKNGKIFDDQFNLLIDDREREKILVDNYCFEFGGKIYYSSVKKDRVELNILKHIGVAKDHSGFPYLGVHGGYELCSGSRVYEDWCNKAKFLGVECLAIVEKHTLAGALKFQAACDKANIKSIIGETVTVKYNKEEYKVKLYVQNTTGWQNLLKIHKELNIDNEGKYVSQESLIQFSEGLFCVFNHDLLIDDVIIDKYMLGSFTDVYFQLDPVQYKANSRDLHCLNCLKTALQLHLPLILICDSYYLDKQDFKVKQILQFVGSPGFEYQSETQYFKSLEDVSLEMLELFTTKGEEFAFITLEEALANTIQLGEKCDFKIKLGEIKLPKYKMTQEEQSRFGDSETFFWHLVNVGLQSKIFTKPEKSEEVYLKRIEVEYDIISRGGFIDYFLILNDVIRWCQSQGILVGAGRGSGAGSLIAYLLDLVYVDPLEYGLIFERFLNEGRIGRSLPDLDTDVQGGRRDEVKRYIEQRYGVENVCSIGTYGTFQLKAAFRDLLRMKGVTTQVANYFGAMLTVKEGEDDFNQLFIDGLKSPALKGFIDEHGDIVNEIDLIFNQPKNASVHAAGVVITPVNDIQKSIFDWMPIKKINGILISEWEGPELESAGFLKEDILGIKQLDKFDEIFKLIRQNGKTPPTFETIDYNDPNVLQLFHKGWNQDLFHFGSPGLTSYSQDVKPNSFEELIAMIALYRPGAMEFGAHESYVKIKQGKKQPEYDWGCEEITKETLSLLVYQEQAMKMCQVLAGFSLTEADDVRKYMGKKQMDKLIKVKDRFVSSAVKNGCLEYEAVKIWNKIEAFGSYAFNKSHSCVYSMTGYFCQYLKYYYPMEFWTVSLQFADEDEIPSRISEIRKFKGITILPPDINKSQRQFTSDFDTKTIFWSLGKIKFAGEAAVNEIIEQREKGGKFFSLKEFVTRIDKRKVNKRVVTNLILAGCFDSIYNVEVNYQRREIIAEFLGEEMSPEFKTKEPFFWFSKQKEISQSGYFDYSSVVANSLISFAPQRYLTPDRMKVMENVDKVVIVTGLLIEVLQRKSKKGPFAQLKIDHNNEMIEVTLWNDCWEKYKGVIEASVNRGIIILGQIKGPDSYKKYNTIKSIDDTVIEIF